jgi:AhpD family alkylhydroperoxidase
MSIAQQEYEPEVARIRRMSPKVTGGLLRAKDAAYEDGIFPAKVKILTSLAISVTIRCEPCIKTYVEKSLDLGVTEQELIEFLNVAMAMQGCPGEAWALKAYKIFLDMSHEKAEESEDLDACCAH